MTFFIQLNMLSRAVFVRSCALGTSWWYADIYSHFPRCWLYELDSLFDCGLILVFSQETCVVLNHTVVIYSVSRPTMQTLLLPFYHLFCLATGDTFKMGGTPWWHNFNFSVLTNTPTVQYKWINWTAKCCVRVCWYANPAILYAYWWCYTM